MTGIGVVYTVPCEVELNVTFKFGNISIPIHPLDTSSDDLGRKDANGDPLCLGGFQPIQPSAVDDTYDMILGMSFCECICLSILPCSLWPR